METFPDLLLKARQRLLKMHFEAGVGHIGGNLSCLDALMVAHHKVMGSDDLFVLSKGHSAGALYVTLFTRGVLKDEDLSTFHKDHTHLSGHPSPRWRKEVPFATGSLGHGLPLAAGLALGKRLKGEKGRVLCLMSDGEWQEGSNWEALIFAVRRSLSNLTLMVDWNGLQGFGSTEEVAGISSLKGRFEAFGVPTEEIDGHDLGALERAWKGTAPGPRAVLARTKKGKGVPFMEDRMEWHYLPMTEAQYRQALEGLGRP